MNYRLLGAMGCQRFCLMTTKTKSAGTRTRTAAKKDPVPLPFGGRMPSMTMTRMTNHPTTRVPATRETLHKDKPRVKRFCPLRFRPWPGWQSTLWWYAKTICYISSKTLVDFPFGSRCRYTVCHLSHVSDETSRFPSHSPKTITQQTRTFVRC